MRIVIASTAFAALALSACPTLADDIVARSAAGDMWLSGSVGLMNIKAREYVYAPDNQGSELDWDSKGVVVFSLGGGAEIANGWKIRTKVDIGTGGNGYMADYDWIDPNYTDKSKNGWSDRSLHPDTRLDHYVSGSIEIARDLITAETGRVGMLGGFKYSDVQWSAFGGSYIYSTTTPRDTVGDFAPGDKVISYRQKIPTAYLGLDGSTVFDRLTLSGGVNGGLSFGINDIDDHWLGPTHFEDAMKAAPLLMLSAAADYKITPNASIFIAGDFEKVFSATGDMTKTESRTTDYNKGAAGASLQNMSVKFGQRGTF